MLPEGDRQMEGAALSQLALQPDLAAVKLDELPHDGEPETGAARLLCSQGLDRHRLVESLLGAATDNPA